MDNVSLQQIFNRIPLLMYRYFGSFASDYVPILVTETFAFINTQHSNIQGEIWTNIANSRHKSFSADSLGQRSFLNQQYKQMMTQPLQSLTSVCCFYTIYAAFHLLNFRQEEITGVNNANVLSFEINYL